ncbi:MAG: hypothetical protein R3E95_15300 [Thiolinea sp.]
MSKTVARLGRYTRRHFPELCAQLQAETAVDPQLRQSGLLMLDADQQREAGHWARSASMPCNGCRVASWPHRNRH